MALAIRDFSYMFSYSKRVRDYSTLSRISLSISLVVSTLLSRTLFNDPTLETIKLVEILVLELLVGFYLRGARLVLSALRLVVFFVALGALIFYVSYLVGWATPGPVQIALGALSLVSLFMALSFVFQFLSLGEWRRLFTLLGLKKYAVLFSLVISQIPVTIYYASEAFTTVRVKYGNKKLYKVTTPLILLSLSNARNLLESHALYGVYQEHKLTLFKKKDLVLYATMILLAIILLS